MKKFVFALFGALSICSVSSVHVQGAPPLVPLVMIDFGDEPSIHLHSDTGQFSPISINPSETADVQLHFPAVYGGMPLDIEPMDGGSIAGQSLVIDSRGWASFQFQAFTDAGQYRVQIGAGGTISTLQFSVPSQ